MTELPSFDAVLFDLDGLVLDTEPTYLYAWRKAAVEFGAKLDNSLGHRLFGQHADAVMQALQDLIGPSFERERFHVAASSYWHQYLNSHGVVCMPGLEKLLDSLAWRHIPYALATNSDAPYAKICLERAGIDDRFPIRVSRDQVQHGKPEPDLFLEAARRLSVDPGRCLVLEDSPTGLEAARRAGTMPVLVQARPVEAATLTLAVAHFHSLEQIADAIEAKCLSTELEAPWHSQNRLPAASPAPRQQ